MSIHRTDAAAKHWQLLQGVGVSWVHSGCTVCKTNGRDGVRNGRAMAKRNGFLMGRFVQKDRCGRGKVTVGPSNLQRQMEQGQPEPPSSSKTAMSQCNSRLATSRIRAFVLDPNHLEYPHSDMTNQSLGFKTPTKPTRSRRCVMWQGGCVMVPDGPWVLVLCMLQSEVHDVAGGMRDAAGGA
eukprot:1158281-Pelagomonas_calceolata.AAC.16